MDTRIKKILYDLVALGQSVVYLPEYKWYIIHESSTFYNPSNHIHDITLKGKDITDMIDNFDSNFQDKHTIETKINQITSRNYLFDKETKFVWIKP